MRVFLKLNYISASSTERSREIYKMAEIKLIPVEEFRRVHSSSLQANDKLKLLADMCRANALAAVKRAGSGHLGSSLSSMDILVRLYYKEMNLSDVGVDSPDRDIFFSSKGHDVPASYAVLYSLGIIPEEKFVNLRRHDGLEGHPDVSTPGIEANSGSLGMGISKARGMLWAKKYKELPGKVFVLTGDGEMQEGQNYEALQSTVQQKMSDLVVIVDHNKIQSDKLIKEIVSLGDMIEKFSSFGWHVERCNGNDQAELEQAFAALSQVTDRPKILIADTIKGCGVSFMEHTTSMKNGLYPWHAGAPADEDFENGHAEVIARVNAQIKAAGLEPVSLKVIAPPPVHDPVYTLDGEPVSLEMPLEKVSKESSEFVAVAFGEALLEIAERRKDIVVLDADLSADCKIRAFENKYPERFIECGIAEQDMVSMAGGLARQGLLPVVNSFASFLASRANEQIYNNASEKTKIIYALHYAGMIPAGPGKSHQSIRDISLLGALPNMEVIQPCSGLETKAAMDYAVDEAENNVAIRLIIGPSPRKIALPEAYKLTRGVGTTLREGSDAVVISYGPVMLHEVLIAKDLLSSRDINIEVINMPWLNRIDRSWLEGVAGRFMRIMVVEDHSPIGGLADRLRECMAGWNLIAGRHLTVLGVEGYPAYGTPPEALKYHGLDGASIAERLLEDLDSDAR